MLKKLKIPFRRMCKKCKGTGIEWTFLKEKFICRKCSGTEVRY